MNPTAKPTSIVSSKGRRMYLTADGGYETSKSRRQRRLAARTTA